MIAELQYCKAEAGSLQAALGGRDAAAIIAASERLAAAIVAMRDLTAATGTPQEAAALIGEVLDLLQAAAIQVNMLRHGTRQQIDSLNVLRGSSGCTYSAGRQ